MRRAYAKKNRDTIYRDTGSISLCNWYRPPGGDFTSMDSLAAEIEQVHQLCSSCIIAGDLNSHHRTWLRFSNGGSALGQKLCVISDNYGLRQLVKEPTRNEYLLDLVLADIDSVKIQVGSSIADHRSVCIDVADTLECNYFPTRQLFQFVDADWLGIKIRLNSID